MLKSIASVGALVALGVVLHNGIGLLGGYWGGRLLGFDEAVCRTLAIEVGMQNSGLAATLGRLYFTPIAALPGALFSVWHNLSGSLLAGYGPAVRPTVRRATPIRVPPALRRDRTRSVGLGALAGQLVLVSRVACPASRSHPVPASSYT
jgi:BASS family bile acid:Na+ symporter